MLRGTPAPSAEQSTAPLPLQPTARERPLGQVGQRRAFSPHDRDSCTCWQTRRLGVGSGPRSWGAPTKTRVSVTHMHMRVYTHRLSFRRPDGNSAPTGRSHGARARDWPSRRAPHAAAWGRLGTDTARPRGLADPGPAPRRGRGQATYLWPASSTDPHSRTRTLCRADLEPSKAVQPLGGCVRPL